VVVAISQACEVSVTTNPTFHESESAIEKAHHFFRHSASVGPREALRCQLPDKRRKKPPSNRVFGDFDSEGSLKMRPSLAHWETFIVGGAGRGDRPQQRRAS